MAKNNLVKGHSFMTSAKMSKFRTFIPFFPSIHKHLILVYVHPTLGPP